MQYFLQRLVFEIFEVKDLSLDLFGNKLGDDGIELISKASCLKTANQQYEALKTNRKQTDLVKISKDLVWKFAFNCSEFLLFFSVWCSGFAEITGDASCSAPRERSLEKAAELNVRKH